MKNIFYIIVFFVLFSSCNDFLTPDPYDGTYDEEFVWKNGTYHKNILYYLYAISPGSWNVANGELLDVATDDAVSSNMLSTVNNLSKNLQTPLYNISYLNTWTNDYEKLRLVNNLMIHIGEAMYNNNPAINDKFVTKFKGDTYFLRAWYHWSLLLRFGGKVQGTPMGVPIVTRALNIDEAINIKRNNYAETIDAILQDCDSALKYVPVKYSGGDLVWGQQYIGCATKNIVNALKSIVLIFHASPAYTSVIGTASWEKATDQLIITLKMIDGNINSNALPPRLFHSGDNPDVIWRSAVLNNNYNFEIENFPPSLRGKGRTNPSQNLVEAFPMKDGYPIGQSPNYNYDADRNPFVNRDPRLDSTVIYNGALLGKNIIYTAEDSLDSRENFPETGTRTGYYISKLLGRQVILYPTPEKNAEQHYFVRISKTELYLFLAEAINEVVGPLDASKYGISAKDVLAKIRKRAGFINDPYMNEIASKGKEAFRELIKNERRIELCFEGIRYWDMRRWSNQLNGLNGIPVYGITITKDANGFLYKKTNTPIEVKSFKSIYNPIPYVEISKMKDLYQNDGWN